MATEGETVTASSSNVEEEIKKLMGKGKVHMVCSEFMDAVKCFEESTKMLDQKHGEGADGCGEGYFYYGKSLLEVARMEGGVLGNALQGAIDSNAQENGDDADAEGKSEEETKENKEEKPTTSENKTDDEKAKENDIFVGDKVGEAEKEKIFDDVLDAMTEDRSTKDTAEAPKTDDNKPMEETPSEVKGDIKSDTASEVKDTAVKDDVTSEVKATAVKDDATSAAKDDEMTGDKKEESEEKDNKKEEKDSEKEDKQEEENKDENNEEGAEENEEGDDENMETEDGEVEGEEVEGEAVGDAEGDAENEDEPTYMELAWQMLEMARLIFSKRDTKEGKLLLGQCHLKLGEIQMEQEQFLGAVEDFLKCMDIQKELLSPDDRLLAETAYNIALAFSFQSMHEKSKDYYSQALDTISLRIKSLQESIGEAEAKSKGKEKATPDNPLVANTKELKELQELYPEIKLKVDDAEEMIKQSKNKPDISSVMGNGSTTTIGFGDSKDSGKAQPTTMIATKKKPVAATDITHLVHRNKRKPEEAETDETAAKKPRPDPEGTEPNGKTETTNNNAQAATAET